MSYVASELTWIPELRSIMELKSRAFRLFAQDRRCPCAPACPFFFLFPLLQASYQRAKVLMSIERYEEALVELEVVRDNVPKESAVYFLMGKVRNENRCAVRRADRVQESVLAL